MQLPGYMSNSLFDIRNRVLPALLVVLVLSLVTGCHSTRYLAGNQYLVRKNKIILKSDKIITNRGEIKDNLARMATPKPNSYFMGIFPIKLTQYNRKYERYHDKPDSLIPKGKERPALVDSGLLVKSLQNMKTYMFNQGFFYAKVQDTIIYRKRKAYIHYTVSAGSNYLINRVNYSFDDSTIAGIIRKESDATMLKKGTEFTYSLLEDERSRIVDVAGNKGYRRFSQDNITFQIDTIDKALFRVAGSPFENAVNFIAQTKSNKKTTIDIDVTIRRSDDTLAYHKYTVGKVVVYPDFKSVADRTDTSMIKKKIGDVDFRYHNYYVHDNVLEKHIFLNQGSVYSKADEDKTATKLGELGIFQSIRVQLRESKVLKNTLDCDIYLNRTKKLDFTPNYEVSSGSTYALGNSLSLNYRNKNFLKGANLLTISLSGGVELQYNQGGTGNVYNRFDLYTEYYGLNANLDFPKFLAPIASSLFDNSNVPHTIIGGGENVLYRVDYFTLINSSASFSYSWRQSATKTWGLSPAFINVIQVPKKSLQLPFP